MDGIDRIIGHIRKAGAEECEAIRAAAAEECEQVREAYAKAELETYRDVIDAGGKDSENRQKRLNSLAALEAKKQLLSARQDLMSQAFELAAKTLLELPGPEYIELLAKLACRASRDGDEAVVLSPYDRDNIGGAVVEAANAALLAAGKKASLALSDKTARIRGGLILSSGDIDVNCSIDALIDQHRLELTPAVADILFE